MSVISDLNQGLVEAMKAKEATRVSAIRFLLSNIQNAQIAKRADLTDEEVIDVIAKDAKRHRESIEAYEKAGRDELVNKEKLELVILNKYLPSQLSEGDISTIIDEVMSEISAKGTDDFGKVIGAVMVRVKGKADGKIVSSLVRAKLG